MARTPQFDRDIALDSAMGLFWKQGYHATSMKDVEYALDMRPGSIYATFGSKEKLFYEALNRYGTQTTDMFAEALAVGDTELEGFKNLIVSMVEQCQQEIPSKACMVVKSLLEFSYIEEMDEQPVIEFLNGFEKLFTEKYQRAIDRGELAQHADPGRLARLYQTNIIGLSVMVQRGIPEHQQQQLIEDMQAHILPAH